MVHGVGGSRAGALNMQRRREQIGPVVKFVKNIPRLALVPPVRKSKETRRDAKSKWLLVDESFSRNGSSKRHRVAIAETYEINNIIETYILYTYITTF